MRTLLLISFLFVASCFAVSVKTYDEALALGAKENKPIIVTVVVTNCPWCHKMVNDTFKNQKIANIMQNKFISVILNKDTDKLDTQFNARLTPTTYFLNSKGEKITRPAVGYFSANDFEDFLKEALSKTSK